MAVTALNPTDEGALEGGEGENAQTTLAPVPAGDCTCSEHAGQPQKTLEISAHLLNKRRLLQDRGARPLRQPTAGQCPERKHLVERSDMGGALSKPLHESLGRAG